MGEPTTRSRTFADGDAILKEFLNEWVQDHIIDLRADVDAHGGDTSDAHGSTQTATVKYVAPLFESSSPAEVRFVDPAAFSADKDSASVRRFYLGSLYADVANSTMYQFYAELPFLRPGDVITRIDLVTQRTAGSIQVEVRHHVYGAATDITAGGLIVNSGAAAQSVAWTGTHTVAADKPYQAYMEITNGGSSGDITLVHLKVTFNRTKR